MGVMACDRKGCENVMCDRLSHDYGYICYECYQELVDSGPETNVEVFMNTDKKPTNMREEAEARYDFVFPILNHMR